jgi:hypothetical protein
MRPVVTILALALLVAPAVARPQAGGTNDSGLAATFSFAGGGELGLDHGKAGVVELEGTVGYELQGTGARPELGVTLGVAPDDHIALRPGFRYTLQPVPIQLRIALDASTSRGGDLRWRWLLIGVGYEVRFTSLLGFYGEIDSGASLRSEAGIPLLLRAGVSLRF